MVHDLWLVIFVLCRCWIILVIGGAIGQLLRTIWFLRYVVEVISAIIPTLPFLPVVILIIWTRILAAQVLRIDNNALHFFDPPWFLDFSLVSLNPVLRDQKFSLRGVCHVHPASFEPECVESGRRFFSLGHEADDYAKGPINRHVPGILVSLPHDWFPQLCFGIVNLSPWKFSEIHFKF